MDGWPRLMDNGMSTVLINLSLKIHCRNGHGHH
jgi:hypothetical protein